MIAGSRAGRRLAVTVFGFVVLSLAAIACSPTTSVTPSPSAPPATPAPTPSPTPAVTSSPSPGASASVAAAPDPAVGLKIAAPYELQTLDPATEATIRQQLTGGSAGAFGSLIGVGGRNVMENGAPIGFVFLVGLPPGVMNDAVYQSIVSGVESNTGVTFKTTKIEGTDVSAGASGTGNVGVYRDGDKVVILITPSAAKLEGIAKALISAN